MEGARCAARGGGAFRCRTHENARVLCVDFDACFRPESEERERREERGERGVEGSIERGE